MREDWYVVPAQYAMRLAGAGRRAGSHGSEADEAPDTGLERLLVLHPKPTRRLPRVSQQRTPTRRR